MSATETSDSGMYKMMAIVLGALCLFTLICVVGARILGVEGGSGQDSLMQRAMLDRIEPVGSVRTAESAAAEAEAAPAAETTAAAGSAAAAPAAEAKTPEQLVQAACAACHVSGVAGAPKLDDAAAWASRNEAGLDAMVASVINGKGAMPPRGGSPYNDEEILAAVKQMTGL